MLDPDPKSVNHNVENSILYTVSVLFLREQCEVNRIADLGPWSNPRIILQIRIWSNSRIILQIRIWSDPRIILPDLYKKIPDPNLDSN